MNVFSDHFRVEIDAADGSIRIFHVEGELSEFALVTIRKETYRKMNFDQLAAFLGARIVLLSTTLKGHYAEEIDAMVKPS